MLRSGLIVILLMTALSWPSLSMPFRGDEAIFTIMAREWSQGAMLYRDYWDITNPGIFCFYRCGGTLFGFNEEGIRVFEWLYITSFIFVFSARVRTRYSLADWPLMPTVLIGGAYYFAGYSSTSHLSKTEGLAAFPLVLAMWLTFEPSRSGDRRHWLVVAGVAGGVVVLFKLLFGVCLIACWGVWLYREIRNRGWKAATISALTLVVGVLLVIAPTVAYFAAHGMFDTLVRTLFVFPRQFLDEGERASPQRLAISVRWFLEQYSPVLALAILGIATALRNRNDRILNGFLLLFVASTSVILLQSLSWWSYHFMLLGGISSVTAAYGWPAICEEVRNRIRSGITRGERVTIVIIAIALCLPALTSGAYPILQLTSHRFGLTAADREACRDDIGQAYREAKIEAAWVCQPNRLPGPIYVCGDPLIYWFADRRPAVPISGWSLEMYPRVVRNELVDSIQQQRPVYIFLSCGSQGYESLIHEKYPELALILETQYKLSQVRPTGKWYTLRAR